ncbi:CgeB family protein [Paraburkholderia caffeinilytica]|uniref:hypothetical protein n=1 Tax=Paraburkholderia caffeinilytica TaxID=1761016 RepID=UPI0038B8EDD3
MHQSKMKTKSTVLLIAPLYFGYDQLLAQCLRDRDVEVDCLPDRPFNSSVGKAMIRLNRNVVLPYADRFYKSRVAEFGRQSYDAIWIVQGEAISPALLKWIKREFPGTPVVWYLWDSFRNKPALLDNLSYFDSVFTFDPQDARQFGIGFQPLFFSPQYAAIEANPTPAYDMCFIGTGHEDRFRVVQSLKAACPEKRFYTFFYLQSPLLYGTRRLTDKNLAKTKPSDFSFKKMAQQEVKRIVGESQTVIDVQHSAQRGLTMRTLEVLGARRKLITTNVEIKAYDFYDPNNIAIVDRRNPAVSAAFLEQPYREIAPAIRSKYSISGFVEAVVGKHLFANKGTEVSDPLRTQLTACA